jgi:hypothetical protein
MGTGKPRISTAVQLAGRVVQVELALGPVQAELEHVQVQARELETAPVVALELLIGLAVAPELELVQVAAALRTRSVTGAHHHTLPRLAVED